MVRLFNVQIYKTAYPKIGSYDKILDTEFFVHGSYEVDDIFKRLYPEAEPNRLYLIGIQDIDSDISFAKYYNILVRRDKTIIFEDKLYQN